MLPHLETLDIQDDHQWDMRVQLVPNLKQISYSEGYCDLLCRRQWMHLGEHFSSFGGISTCNYVGTSPTFIFLCWYLLPANHISLKGFFCLQTLILNPFYEETGLANWGWNFYIVSLLRDTLPTQILKDLTISIISSIEISPILTGMIYMIPRSGKIWI